MTARILQVVNSASLGLGRRITSVEEALAIVGTRTIGELVESAHVFRALADPESPRGQAIARTHQHSVLAARIARQLVDDRATACDAFAAALLHDVGELLMTVYRPDAFAAVQARASAQQEPLHVAERAVNGYTHAEAGAGLLALWGLPESLVQAAAFHHEPVAGAPGALDIVGAVHVASGLADELDPRHAGAAGAAIDVGYLDRIELAHRLPEWRARAARLVTASR